MWDRLVTQVLRNSITMFMAHTTYYPLHNPLMAQMMPGGPYWCGSSSRQVYPVYPHVCNMTFCRNPLNSQTSFLNRHSCGTRRIPYVQRPIASIASMFTCSLHSSPQTQSRCHSFLIWPGCRGHLNPKACNPKPPNPLPLRPLPLNPLSIHPKPKPGPGPERLEVWRRSLRPGLSFGRSQKLKPYLLFGFRVEGDLKFGGL